ncbi:hypothetical protein GH714_029526 [Hevea brasiliensis]|uniref:Uncharacterized protein n=1 Tax=Hevea brasiliensis TaxID=3981 RepID=A0A6A6K9N3_HEVBR|nr:hypothetical protein GH714_029526 [Hevea brasiliensis]
MFTEGLDESAINWIKQGSDVQERRIRSPLSPLSEELCSHNPFPKSPTDPIQKSPLLYNSNNFSSSHLLPPLKFHSGLLTPRNLVAPCLDDNDNESVASVTDYMGGNYSEEEEDVGVTDIDYLEKPDLQCYDEEEIHGNRPKTRLNRGLLKEDLKIVVPDNFGRFSDCDLASRKTVLKNSTPAGSCPLRERVQMRNAHAIFDGNYSHKTNVFKEAGDLGTPSAPPIVETGGEEKSFVVEAEIQKTRVEVSESRETDPFDGSREGLVDGTSQSMHSTEFVERLEKTMAGEKEETMPYWQTSSLDYNASGQYAWQTLITYDACIRLCLHAWARGCTEAPEFLLNECLLLRSAFGLHKFLLQPRGVQPIEVRTMKNAEQIFPSKIKKVAGKIRVEVRKLRIIPRRKLKSTYSQRSAIYMQMGKEYAQHFSSLVKTGMNSLKLASFSVTSEEQLSCLFQLKSTSEDAQLEQGSTISLRPGSGEYHVLVTEFGGGLYSMMIKNVLGIQLSIGSTITCDENNIKSGPVVETLAYNLLLEAAMRAQHFQSQNLRLHGPWKWLLTEFADYYGVSDSYTKLRYLWHVMNVATPTRDCLELVNELLVPIIKARGDKSLTRQEIVKHKLRVCWQTFSRTTSLWMKLYTGLADLFGPVQESAAPALAPAVEVYAFLHDILSQDAQTMLRNYLQTAAKKSLFENEESVYEYGKEIQADIKIHNQHIFPSSIDLSNITAAVYSTELCNRLRSFLCAWPPSSPQPHVNELLIAVADFERNLDLWNISPVQGGVDSRGLFHSYIMVWVQDMQLNLLDQCKAEKVPWAGVTTNHTTSPFAEEMYEKIKDSLIEYEVVINRWPQYSLILENMQANRSTRLKRILEEIKEEDGEAEVRERMHMLSSQLIDSISNLHEVFTGRIFVAACRGLWDRMGQIVLKFLEGRKENRVWYNGSCYALGILDDTFASEMQRLLGNSLQDKDLEPPRSVIEARSILCRDATNAADTSTYFYV